MFALGVALAALAGVVLGLLGGGGSIMMVPILVYVIGEPPHVAVATSLAAVGTTSAVALLPHARAGRVRWRTGLVFGGAGMVGAYAAGSVAHYLPAGLLLTAFGVMMVVTAAAMLRGRRPQAEAPRDLPVPRALGYGFAVGALAGLVGAGGGFLVVPALVLLGGLAMDAAVGTSLLVITLSSLAGLAGHLGGTSFDAPVAVAVTGAAVIGSLLGGRWSSRVSPAALRRAFAWLVIAMAVFILGQEVPRALGVVGSAALPFAATGALATLLAGAAWTARASRRAA